VFTAPRGGRCALELECDRLGIKDIHSRPYHPQTCGKVERFHPTQQRSLAKDDQAESIGELQEVLGGFRTYYNESDLIGRSPGRRRPKPSPHGPRSSPADP